MTTATDTQRARLERAFETLQRNGILVLLKLKGSTGVFEWNLDECKRDAAAAGFAHSWAGAHVGAEELRGAYWDDQGVLRFRGDDTAVQQLWFSFPLGRDDIAQALVTELERQAFYASWFTYDEAGNVLGPGTDCDAVRLVLKEED